MKVYIALALRGSGSYWPEGVFDSKEKAYEALKTASGKHVLVCNLNEGTEYGIREAV